MSSLTNKMTKFYVGLVEDIIRDENNNPTADLRIRIPNLHLGLKTEELPIAKPIYVPGTKINRNLLIEQIDNIKRVYVIFEYGDTSRPRYIGVADFVNDYDITTDADEINLEGILKISDIVDDLETDLNNKPLSAGMGKEIGDQLKGIAETLEDIASRESFKIFLSGFSDPPTTMKKEDFWYEVLGESIEEGGQDEN